MNHTITISYRDGRSIKPAFTSMSRVPSAVFLEECEPIITVDIHLAGALAENADAVIPVVRKAIDDALAAMAEA